MIGRWPFSCPAPHNSLSSSLFPLILNFFLPGLHPPSPPPINWVRSNNHEVHPWSLRLHECIVIMETILPGVSMLFGARCMATTPKHHHVTSPHPSSAHPCKSSRNPSPRVPVPLLHRLVDFPLTSSSVWESTGFLQSGD